MTDFLVKCFVKDHDKTEDPQVRTRYGNRRTGLYHRLDRLEY